MFFEERINLLNGRVDTQGFKSLALLVEREYAGKQRFVLFEIALAGACIFAENGLGYFDRKSVV
jgi:hypothetical protein